MFRPEGLSVRHRNLSRSTLTISLFILLFFISSCTSPPPADPLVIAISKGAPSDGYGNYGKWLTALDSTVVWVDMYNIPFDSAMLLVEECDGLLVSGGPDVHPGIYGQAHDTLGCGVIDHYRDSLEFALIEHAVRNRIPILGICRGEQILNVYFGGTLYIDLPTDIRSDSLHRCVEWWNCEHPVSVPTGTRFSEITGAKEGIVTTNHHQAIKQLADGLKAVAFSNDSIIEAIEYADPTNDHFLLAVQWHPERMEAGDPLSWPIGKAFIEAAGK